MKKGSKHKPESIIKMKKIKKDFNKGRRLSEKTKIKLSLSKKGKPAHPNSGFRKGNKLGKNKKAWNKGLPKEKQPFYNKNHSKEAREKIKKSNTGLCQEKSHNWKGGISKIKELIRNMPEYFKWRSDVFQRDNWTCQTCHKKGVYLEAHHKIELNKIVKEYEIKTILDARRCILLWDLDNGVTLCYECHNLTKKRKKNAV